MPPEVLPPDFAQIATAQGLDPAILAMAQQAMQGGMGDPMMPNGMPMGPANGLPPASVEDVIANSQLLLHADDMAPMLQVATQDELIAFIEKVIRLYREIV